MRPRREPARPSPASGRGGPQRRPALSQPAGGGGGSPKLELAIQWMVDPAALPRRRTLRRWMQAALERPASVTLRFVGAREGRTLNRRYRGRDYATNVLTFVYDDVASLAGDIVLCAPVMRREARAQRRTLAAHCAHLVIHGMLHLQGYDHERDDDAARMEARERALLAQLGHRDACADARGDS
ncbi:MAG: rRNA maturation RNase YbeY [Betaproteobacteria bacterium]|nr:rRNA maturation RNase YbeY [Betaproteobacteria bacterium]